MRNMFSEFVRLTENKELASGPRKCVLINVIINRIFVHRNLTAVAQSPCRPSLVFLFNYLLKKRQWAFRFIWEERHFVCVECNRTCSQGNVLAKMLLLGHGRISLIRVNLNETAIPSQWLCWPIRLMVLNRVLFNLGLTAPMGQTHCLDMWTVAKRQLGLLLVWFVCFSSGLQ